MNIVMPVVRNATFPICVSCVLRGRSKSGKESFLWVLGNPVSLGVKVTRPHSHKKCLHAVLAAPKMIRGPKTFPIFRLIRRPNLMSPSVFWRTQ